MAESFIQLPPNSTGLKAHTNSRVIGANTVEDEGVFLAEQYLASYGVSANVAAATNGVHVLQVMAGASKLVRIRSILIDLATATAAGAMRVGVVRLTTAGTGGTAITPLPFNTADGASGATAMSTVVTPGTEAASLFQRVGFQTAAAAPQPSGQRYIWTPNVRTQPYVIAAGVANGIAIKVEAGVAGGTINVHVEFDESSF